MGSPAKSGGLHAASGGNKGGGTSKKVEIIDLTKDDDEDESDWRDREKHKLTNRIQQLNRHHKLKQLKTFNALNRRH